MRKLTQDEKATNYETMLHIKEVQRNTNKMAAILIERGLEHDKSKLEPPEVEYFTEYTPILKDLEYGTPEYYQCLKEMEPAINHHYENNSHHPQFYSDGIAGMNLIDLMELMADWMAAVKRTKDGNIWKSLEVNIERFQIEPQLANILRNTVALLEENPSE